MAHIMAELVLIPHFDLPFRLDTHRHGRVAEQDTEADVTNCVYACLLTRRGTRYYVTNFGIDDPTFKLMPIDLVTIEQQVAENEPRARMVLSQSLEVIRDYIQVQVGVDLPRE